MYPTFIPYFFQEYIPNTRVHIGIYALPGGEAFYRDCIKWYLGEDQEPFSIHEAALNEIEIIRQKIDRVSTVMYKVLYWTYWEICIIYDKGVKFLLLAWYLILRPICCLPLSISV